MSSAEVEAARAGLPVAEELLAVPPEERQLLLWQLVANIARHEEAREAARRDPAEFVSLFCWGRDFERNVDFKARPWPWQARLFRHLAWIEPFSAEVPLSVSPGGPGRYILLKARGVGATWAAVWYAAWEVWARPPCQVVIMSDTERKAIDVLSERYGYVRRMMPPELGYPGVRTRVESRQEVLLDNGSELISLSGDPENIRNYHPSLLILDEAARYRSTWIPAVAGLRSRVLALSTADGFGNDFARVWLDAQDNGGRVYGFVPIFVAWKERPTYARRPEARADVRAQEFPETANEAFLASGRPFFDLEAVARSEEAYGRPPLWTEADSGGTLSVWEEPEAGARYLIAADVAEGIQEEEESAGEAGEVGGPDYSYACVREWDTGQQVAAWHGRTSAWEFAGVLHRLWRMYPGLVVPERNVVGVTVAERLANLEPRCVYFTPPPRRRPGWHSTPVTRMAALDELAKAISAGELACAEAAVYNEMRTFVYGPDNKPRARASYHDDRVMAWAISEWIRSRERPPRPEGREAQQGPLPVVLPDWERFPL